MRRGLLTLLLALGAGPAAAHGPAPAALGALDARLDGVRGNLGLALRGAEGGWSFGCPALWGADEGGAPALRLEDGTLVVAWDGAVHLGGAGACGLTRHALGEGSILTGLAADGDAAWVAARVGDGGRVWRVTAEGPAEVADLVGLQPDGLVAADGVAWVGGARPAPALVRVHAAGAERVPLDLPVPADYLDPRGVEPGGPRFLLAATGAGPRLLERRAGAWAVVAQAERALHGPVRLGDAWLLVADGVTRRRADGDADFADLAAPLRTCLQRAGDAVFACVDRGLDRLTPDGAARPVFRVDDLAGAPLACTPPALRAACELQWLHEAGESGLLGDAGMAAPGDARADATFDEPADAAPDDRAAAGCASTSAPAASPLVLLLLAAAARRRG
ncbi:MAG: hypothetical protein H6704_31160 [Myxococcales bacterium]|nr:hypothetical protein [Myxococcales bacterium]